MNELFHCRAFSGGWTADGRFALSGSTPHYAPDRPFDSRHLRLELRLDFGRKTLSGRCVTTLAAIQEGAQTMVFDAVDFKNVRVRSGHARLRHDYDRRKLTVHWPRPVRRGQAVDVTIDYRVIQ